MGNLLVLVGCIEALAGNATAQRSNDEVPAAAAVAAAPAVQPTATTVSPLTVKGLPNGEQPPIATARPAATIVVPSDDTTGGGHWASVWPIGAYEARISGHVILTCDIDHFGLAEWCNIASENPKGRGFGQAALELRPTFKLKPSGGPDDPTDTVLNIAVDFNAPDPIIDFGRNREGGPVGERAGARQEAPQQETADITEWREPLVRRSVAMLNNPIWVKTAGYDDVLRAYPAKAPGMEGYAVAHCEVKSSGALAQCQVIKEDPEDKGFGKAAVKLASQFRVSPDWVKAPGHADLWVDVPIRFPAAAAAGNRTVATPYWVAGFDPDQALKLFPPEAATKGITTGRGIAKCVVEQDGSLSDCAPEPGDPEGLGFSDAAVRLASTMRMNPWTLDGEPVDGAVVRLGVKLTLKSN
jgi:TonB family protein